MKRKKKFALGLGIFLGIYALVGFLLIPVIAKSIVPDKLSAALNRPVTIENIAFNPFALILAVEGFTIREADGEKIFAAFDELYINLQISSAVKLGPVIKEARLTRPYLRLARLSDNTFNFSDLVGEGEESEEEEAKPEQADAEKKPLRFSLHQVQIIEGEVVFDDEVVDITHRFAPLNFDLPKLSSFEADIDTFSQPRLTGRVNNTDITIATRTKLFIDSMETIVDIDMKGLRLPHYFPYAPEDIGFEVADGSLDIQTSVSLKRGADQDLSIEASGRASLSELLLVDDTGGHLFSLAGLEMVLAPSTPLQKDIRLSSVILDDPHLTVIRDAGGTIYLTTVGAGASSEKEGDAGQELDVGTRENGMQISDGPEATERQTDSPFIVAVDKFRINNGRVDYRDFAAPSGGDPPVEMVIGDIALSVDDFRSAPEQTASVELSAGVNQTAGIELAGTFGISPLSADIHLEARDIDPSWGQPYVPESIRLAIAGGAFHLTADAKAGSMADGALSASVTGNASLDELSVLDRDYGTDLLTLHSFSVDGIDVSHNPAAVRIDEILIDGLSHELVRQEDGRLNLARIFGGNAGKESSGSESTGDAEPAGEEASAAEQTDEEKKDTDAPASSLVPFPVAINEIRLQDASVNFTDHHVRPNFSTRLDLTEGSVKGLTSESFEGADLKIQGTVDRQSPIDISGRINPLLAEPLVDIDFTLDNMELSPLSPYSGAYIGNAIEKGKLKLNLAYRIEEKNLRAKNQILLDQFSLGRRVDSPDAITLPVGLAIALLKDRRGEINLDIPVSGRTDDPRFSVAKIIVQSLVNIMTKAATSPFALVGSLVGGGEELRYIEFVHGLAMLDEDSEKRVSAVEELLYQRPELNLEMTGYVDVKQDRAALKTLALERELKTLKWVDTGAEKDDDVGGTAEMTLSEEEYGAYLQKLYEMKVLANTDAEAEAKPLSDESLTREEMTESIRQQIRIPDAALGLLSRQRAQAVRNHILMKGRIDGGRLFILRAESLSPEKANKDFAEARVELGLK